MCARASVYVDNFREAMPYGIVRIGQRAKRDRTERNFVSRLERVTDESVLSV